VEEEEEEEEEDPEEEEEEDSEEEAEEEQEEPEEEARAGQQTADLDAVSPEMCQPKICALSLHPETKKDYHPW
jgi:hypothetical protein